MKEIAFDHLKDIVAMNAAAIASRNIETGTGMLAHLRVSIDEGKRTSIHEFGRRVREELVRVIRMFDIRNVSELVELVPRGTDNRIPNFVYDGNYEAELTDRGWTLFRI